MSDDNINPSPHVDGPHLLRHRGQESPQTAETTATKRSTDQPVEVVLDPDTRRRIQNRNAQRNHRRSVKQRLNSVETLNAHLLLAANDHGWTQDQNVDSGCLPSPSDCSNNSESASSCDLAQPGQNIPSDYTATAARHITAGLDPSIAVHYPTSTGMLTSISCSACAAIPHNHAVVDFLNHASGQKGSFPLEDYDIETEYTLPEEAWSSTWESDSSRGQCVFEPNSRMHGVPARPISQLFSHSGSDTSSPQGLTTRRDNMGRTALHEAAVNGHVSVIIQILAVQGALGVLQSTDNEGLTALHLAARHGQVEVVKLLLEEEGRLYQSGAL